MEWLVNIGLALLCIIIGYIFGARLRKVSDKVVGGLIIDKDNPDVNGGVYMVWDVNPMTLTDGQIVKMEVTVADVVKSQEKQSA